VVQGYLQGIPSHKENEKRALLQGTESLVGTRKIQLAMKWKKMFEEVPKLKKYGNHFLSNLIYYGEL
jgi:hypothetical protein